MQHRLFESININVSKEHFCSNRTAQVSNGPNGFALDMSSLNFDRQQMGPKQFVQMGAGSLR
jgi:hypothetical protein